MEFTTAYKIAWVILILIGICMINDLEKVNPWQYHSDADSGMITRADWPTYANLSYNQSALNWSEILKISDEEV